MEAMIQQNAIWIPFPSRLLKKCPTPLVLKVKAELVGFPELELTSYINWKTKEGINKMKPQEMWNTYKAN